MSTTPIVVLTPEQLSELVRRAVEDALAAQKQDTSPALFDRAGIARQLGVSETTLGRLRREGLPCVMIGDSPRFDLATCLAWLRNRDNRAESGG